MDLAQVPNEIEQTLIHIVYNYKELQMFDGMKIITTYIHTHTHVYKYLKLLFRKCFTNFQLLKMNGNIHIYNTYKCMEKLKKIVVGYIHIY